MPSVQQLTVVRCSDDGPPSFPRCATGLGARRQDGTAERCCYHPRNAVPAASDTDSMSAPRERSDERNGGR